MSDEHGDHPPYQRHYFANMVQQSQSTMMGMWLFLVQEILFFGGLFGAYTWYRNQFPDAWEAGAATMMIDVGMFNTIVLIGSSMTIVLAVNAARHGKNNAVIMWFLATLLLGGAFLGVKKIEYGAKYTRAVMPGVRFDWDFHEAYHHVEVDRKTALKKQKAGESLSTHEAELVATGSEDLEQFIPAEGTHSAQWFADHHPAPTGIRIYYALYFVMTGMHALHMVIGVGIAIWIMVLVRRNTFNPGYYPHIEYFGLYWHFVDIVWIFLFPMLYLI